MKEKMLLSKFVNSELDEFFEKIRATEFSGMTDAEISIVCRFNLPVGKHQVRDSGW